MKLGLSGYYKTKFMSNYPYTRWSQNQAKLG